MREEGSGIGDFWWERVCDIVLGSVGGKEKDITAELAEGPQRTRRRDIGLRVGTRKRREDRRFPDLRS
jgi:hypothetical protein